MIKEFLILVCIVYLSIGGCGEGGDGLNNCYLQSSSNPCFESDPGTVEIRTDTTTADVINEEKNSPDFIQEIPVTNILKDRAFVGIPIGLPEDCREWDESVLVIKNTKDWNRFRNSCFYSFYQLPDVDFSENMVIVSIQNNGGLGTSVEAALDLDNETNGGTKLEIIIEDDELSLPNPAPGYPFHIVEVPERQLPADFMRVQKVIQPGGLKNL